MKGKEKEMVIMEGGVEEEVVMDEVMDMDKVAVGVVVCHCPLETKEFRKLHLYLKLYCIVYHL